MHWNPAVEKLLPETIPSTRINTPESHKSSLRATTVQNKCEGSDLNARTPARQGPQPCAFDLAWQPSPGEERGERRTEMENALNALSRPAHLIKYVVIHEI